MSAGHLVHMEPDVLGPSPLDQVLVLMLVPAHEQHSGRVANIGQEEEHHHDETKAEGPPTFSEIQITTF